MAGKTLYEKIWAKHLVDQEEGKPAIIYIDLHLVHEVTSPQAFEGLRLANRKVRRPELTFATMDHNVPTKDRYNIKDPISKKQIETLEANCEEFGVTLFGLNSPHQGIVHVIGPELGLTPPEKQLCAETVIQLPMERLVLLLLASAQAKSNMLWQPNAFNKVNPKQ